MIVPHPYYRLNPKRAIYVSGRIDRELVYRLTPQIIGLLAENRDPITVYIDSPGGVVASAEALLKLLKFPDQNLASGCHIITAVTGQAASAAADLLSSGDYSTAFPASDILYHGVRIGDDSPLTLERTSMLANLLRTSNDIYANELARKIEDRFSLRYVYAREKFEEIRQQEGKPEMSDISVFIHHYIPSKLSSQANRVWEKARERYFTYHTLFATGFKKKKTLKGAKSIAALQGVTIKSIVDFEVKRHKKDSNWTFSDQGMARLVEDFFLLDEYMNAFQSKRLRKWSTSWAKYLLPEEEFAAVNAIADEKERTDQLVKKVSPLMSPVLGFFGALCHALQEGENPLTATDAYWLGLIDEVIGQKELMSLRTIEEFKPDEQAPVAEGVAADQAVGAEA